MLSGAHTSPEVSGGRRMMAGQKRVESGGERAPRIERTSGTPDGCLEIAPPSVGR